MKWIRQFQLFLFDFDGLLVNTEQLHFQAYIDLMKGQGFSLDWTFDQFCERAHLNSSALREALYEKFPDLSKDWASLYEEKKRLYLELVRQGRVALMPGVETLLKELLTAGIRRSVVTHSPLEQIQEIRSQLPILNTIPHWITREDYREPKPHPACYLRAIELYGKPGDRIIGFEDSIRGLEALCQTPALPLLICSKQHPLLPKDLLTHQKNRFFESIDLVSI